MNNPIFWEDDSNKIYNLKPELWYQALPYAFKAEMGGDVLTFYLPINPSNITINTHFATNVIPTMYGTIEEHSEQRYFDINIQGTTGMSPKYATVSSIDSNLLPTKRSSFAKNNTLLGGFAQRTQSLIKGAIQKVAQLASDVGLMKSSYIAGLADENSGYAAFHNFYRFLLLYKKEVMKNNAGGLYFVNYKDNNQYRVAINNFQLIRTAEDPMLYNYSISLRGYDLVSGDTTVPSEIYNMKKRLEDLGLDGATESSVFYKAAAAAREARAAAYSAVAAVKGFGR